MRHQRAGVKLGRTTSHRTAMFRNMVTSLFKHERIRTTDVKAKELRRWADYLIKLAKRGDLHARRQALAVIREKAVVHKLFEKVGDQFKASSGGYTRIIKVGRRVGDSAPMSLIELILAQESGPKKTKKKRDKKAADKKAPAVKKPAADKKETKVETEVAESPAAATQAAPEPLTDAAPADVKGAEKEKTDDAGEEKPSE
jgi:large subunit ribosomal protein L17